jgi:glycosyltransferase involved in cell wall biosynthesis
LARRPAGGLPSGAVRQNNPALASTLHVDGPDSDHAKEVSVSKYRADSGPLPGRLGAPTLLNRQAGSTATPAPTATQKHAGDGTTGPAIDPASTPGRARAAEAKRARVRLLYLVTHPIQYQAPLLAHLAQEPWLDLEVAFLCQRKGGTHFDAGFGESFAWDIDLLEGYRHQFLPARIGGLEPGLLRPWVKGLGRLLDPQRFDAVWLHGYAQVSLLEALLRARRRGLKLLLRGESLLHGRPENDWRAKLRRLCLPPLLRQVDACLAIGEHNAEFYRAYGVPPKRIFKMPYAVDNRRFAAASFAASAQRESLRAELGLEPGLPVVLYASKFQPRKRPGDLISAALRLMRRTRPFELLLIGSGEQRAELEQRVNRSPHVHFLGFKNQTELPRYYDLCDLFVLPSSYEPWGLVLNEAMACGRPVLASDAVGAARDLVIDGVTGWLYPAGDSGELELALQEVLADPEALRQAGRAAQAHIQAFDYTADARGLRQALQSLGLC